MVVGGAVGAAARGVMDALRLLLPALLMPDTTARDCRGHQWRHSRGGECRVV